MVNQLPMGLGVLNGSIECIKYVMSLKTGIMSRGFSSVRLHCSALLEDHEKIGSSIFFLVFKHSHGVLSLPVY